MNIKEYEDSLPTLTKEHIKQAQRDVVNHYFNGVDVVTANETLKADIAASGLGRKAAAINKLARDLVTASGVQTKVYRYACGQPDDKSLEIITRELQAEFEYRNDYTRLNHRVRDRQDAQRCELFPEFDEKQREYDDVQQQLTVIYDEIKARRAETRKRVNCPELNDSVKQLKWQRKDIAIWMQGFRDSRKEENNKLKGGETLPEYKGIKEWRSVEGKKIYAASAASPGCKWRVQNEVKPMDFQTKGWNQSPHKISVQLRGVNTEDLYVGKYKAQLTPVNGRLHTVKVKLTSRPKEVAIELPVILHRPLPPNCKVTRAEIHQTRVGTKFKYHLMLSVGGLTNNDRCLDLTRGIALDVGWRKHDDGSLRVAYWSDTDGNHGEIKIPARRVEQIQHCDTLKSTRDTNFNATTNGLRDFVASLDVAPAWLLEKSMRCTSWRNINRLKGLIRYWSDHRFAGDEEVFRALVGWRSHDNHLLNWCDNKRNNYLDWTKNYFRNVAAHIRRNYGTCVIENIDLSKMVRQPEPDQPSNYVSPYRFIARVSVLTGSLYHPTKIDPAYTSRDCHNCGQTHDIGANQHYRCTDCGTSYDRDHNAAINILKRGGCEPKAIADNGPTDLLSGKSMGDTPTTDCVVRGDYIVNVLDTSTYMEGGTIACVTAL